MGSMYPVCNLMKHLIRWLVIFLTLASCAPLRPPDERLTEAEARINVLEAEISRAEAAHRKAEQSLDEANRNLERQRSIELRLQQDLQNRGEKLSQQIEQIREAREDAEAARAELEEKQRALEGVRSTNVTLKEQVAELEKQADLARRKPGKSDGELTPQEQLAFLKEAAFAVATYGVPGSSGKLDKPPERMNIEDSFNFELVIHPETKSVILSDLVKKVKKEFKVAEDQFEKIVATGIMSAELSGGEGLTITVVADEGDGFVVKHVLLNEKTIWRWKVKAAEEGTHTLSLSLRAHSEGSGNGLDPESKKTAEQLFEEWPIEVYKTAGQKLAGFTGQNYQWIWTAVIIPIFGWIYQMRKSRKG